MCQSALQNSRGAIGDQENQCRKEQDQSQRTRQAGGDDFSTVLTVDFGPRGKLCLVLGFESLLAVSPGAATIQVVSDVRRADDGHGFTTNLL